MTRANWPEMQISNAVWDIPDAMSIRINQMVYDLRREGCDVITLSLGEAYFDIPAFDFRKLDFTRGYHYSDSQGIPELRHRIARYYRERYNAPINPDSQLLISAGSKPLTYMAMLAALNPGDEVLIPEPAWLSYGEQARLVGATPRFLPFDLKSDDLVGLIGDKTKMLIVNNPNNPVGRVHVREEMRALYEICRPRGIHIMVDEAYSDFVLDNSFASMAELVPDLDGVFVINSLSKNLGISGWRIGYVLTHPRMIGQLLKLNQHLITCAPTILLQYCARYFDDIIRVTLPQVEDVVAKRHRVAEIMERIGLRHLGGSSTFYFFVKIEDYPGNSVEFAEQLLREHRVAVVPGSAYGRSTDRFVRVSIGAESEERIEQAFMFIRHMLDKSSARNTASHL